VHKRKLSRLRGLLFAAALAAPALAAASAADAACSDLTNFAIADGKITSAVSVKAGEAIMLPLFHLPLPAPQDFCRVSATLTPSSDSEILAEVWLPDPAKWNGKYLGSGNGGFGGSLAGPMLDMRKALDKGYATAGTNLGHETKVLTPDASWAIGHPEKVKDFAYRADHVTAELAKALIASYYGKPPQYSYFRGCSNGGHEALMEAQRYPADYDGIIAGAPANQWTHLMTNFVWNERALHATPDSGLPASKLALIQEAVLAKCDADDGLLDGIVGNPETCHFNPTTLLCRTGDGPDCLTAAQVDALEKIYDGPVDPKTHKRIYPGFAQGSEAQAHNWDEWITGEHASQAGFGNQFFGAMVYGDPNWDYRTFDFDNDVAKADAELGPIINSDDPDLREFADRGGKLILFQGWDDAAVTPWGTLAYYHSIEKKMTPAKAHDFVRLFMVPGMMHCGGGPGASTFDAVAAMEQWKEHNAAPETMIGSHFKDAIAALAGLPTGPATATRTLCAYPKVSQWNGKGPATAAESFECVLPDKTQERRAAAR
jgi:hypothetical protein